ncbi:RCC1 domain-containing protein [Pilimelia anulata]
MALTAGTAHTCGVRGTGSAGTLYCWGDNSEYRRR